LPNITQGDKTINPTDLFGLWKEQPKQLSDIKKQACNVSVWKNDFV